MDENDGWLTDHNENNNSRVHFASFLNGPSSYIKTSDSNRQSIPRNKKCRCTRIQPTFMITAELHINPGIREFIKVRKNNIFIICLFITGININCLSN